MRTTPTLPAAPRPAGRPRDPRRDAAIFEATLELVNERGFEFSIEEAAERAGVGKTTIYRRFSSKEDLAIAALESALVRQSAPDTGSVRGDLLAFIRARMANAGTISALPLFTRLIGDLWRNPRLLALFTERLVGPGMAPLRAIISRGIARGQLRSDIDEEVVLYALMGGLAYRVLTSADATVIEEQIAAYLDAVLTGVGKREGGPA